MPDDPTQVTPQPAPQGTPAPVAPAPAPGGEPQVAPAPTGEPAGVEPKLYAGKYQSVEAMEQAYQEAESALGRKNDELGQVRQQYDYLAGQLGYDPLASEGNVAPATPVAQPQPVAPTPPQAPPFQRMMEAYLGNDPAGAQRIFEQATRSTAEHVTGARSQAVERLQHGVHGLAAKHGVDTIYPIQGAIASLMQKGLSADDAFFLANRGPAATQQRTAASGEQTVTAGRTAAAGPTAVAQPAVAAPDAGQALKDAMIASQQSDGAYSDL